MSTLQASVMSQSLSILATVFTVYTLLFLAGKNPSIMLDQVVYRYVCTAVSLDQYQAWF